MINAIALFQGNHVADLIDKSKMQDLAFQATQLLCSMEEIMKSTSDAVDGIISSGITNDTAMGLNLPTTSGLRDKADAFIRKLGQIATLITAMMKIAYPVPTDTKRVLEKIRAEIIEKRGDQSRMLQFFDKIRNSLIFARNLRNGWEHPKEEEQTIIKDFHVRADGQVSAPTIELRNVVTPQEQMTLCHFMKETVPIFTVQFQLLMAIICADNLRPFSGWEIDVTEIPEDRRMHPKAKFGYAIKLQGQWTVLG